MSDLITIPTIEDVTRRQFISSAVAAAFVIACSSEDESQEPGSSSSSKFPVTIDHVFGSTTIDAEPKRIVALGGGEQDYLLALGAQPVALARSFGDEPYAVWPWAIDRLTSQPEVQRRSAEPNIEWVVSMNPDLILFHSPVMTQQAYAQLSQVAPTVGPPASYSKPVWQETTERIGLALGRSEEAAAAIKAVEDTLAAKSAEFPELEGVSVAYLAVYLDDGELEVRSTAEPRVQSLLGLGMTVPPAVQALADGQNVSFENLNTLEAADLLFVTCDNQADVQRLMEMPVFQSLKFARNGQYVFIKDFTLLSAITVSSVLSIPFAMEKIPPLLAEGVKGNRVVY